MSPRALLADVRYRRFFVGMCVTRLGTWMSTVGLLWVVLRATHSATATGALTGLYFAPSLVVGPLMAPRIDRVNRRRLLLVCEVLLAVGWAGQALLATMAHPYLLAVYALATVTGCVAAIEAPTLPAFLGDLVGEDALGDAMRMNALAGASARLLGTSLAGVLLVFAGPAWAIAADAASFVLFAAVLVLLGRVPSPRRESAATPRMRDAAALVWRTPELLAPVAVVAVVVTFCRNYSMAIPLLTTALHAGPGGYALGAAAFGVGTTAGSLLVLRLRSTRLALLLSATVLLGVAQLVTSQLTVLAPLVGLLVVSGMIAVLGDSTAATRTATCAPPHMRGRVMAVYQAAYLGGTPVGALFTGLVADALGIRAVFALTGVVALATAVSVAVTLRGWRGAATAAVDALRSGGPEPLPDRAAG